MSPTHWIRDVTMHRPAALAILPLLVLLLCSAVARAAEPCRVVVWDERQPSQKQAYENFLGNRIAAHLATLDGVEVRSVALDDGEQGLAPAILDFAEVLFWWGHVRHAEVKPERGREIVARIRDQGMTFVAIHSAHFATPFMEAMNERTRADVRRAFANVPADALTITELPATRRIPRRDERRTPATDVEKGAGGSVTVRVQMPLCVFPAWKTHGLPSTVRVVAPEHPLAAGLPRDFTLPRTEMYDEPFHVPEPDLVIAEETWEAGERFRSVMLWKLGKGRVIYIRPGHETFPIYDDANMLRLVENVVRTSRAAATP